MCYLGFFPIDKQPSCPTSPRFLCMTSKFWQACVVDAFKLSNSDQKLKFSFVLCHENRTCIAALPIFASAGVFCTAPDQCVAKPTWQAALLLFRSSSSAERFCSLFVDCGCRFVPLKKKLKKQKKEKLCVRMSPVPPHSKCTAQQADIYSLWLSCVCDWPMYSRHVPTSSSLLLILLPVRDSV